MNVERWDCLRIDAAEWFNRDDFMAVVNSGKQATWHVPGQPLDDYSDLFVTYDGGEGCASYDLPGDIWEAICKAAEDIGMKFGIVWIANLEGDADDA